MTDPAPRDRAATRRGTLVLAVMLVALLAGCELATGTVRTAAELQEAGIQNPNLQYDDGVATLEYDADPNPLEARAEQDRAAAVIWRNLPFRIDRITVTGDGGAFPSRRDYPRALLEQQLGPRPENLDRSAADIARRAVVIAAVIGLVVLVLVVVVIVLIVRAVRRRPAPQPAGAWAQGGAQPPWGQPAPPGPQGWSQPSPPGPQGSGQPGYGRPPDQGWPQPPQQQQPPQPPPAPGPPWAETQPPPRGPGDTQRLEPGPPEREDRGPTPPA